MNIECIEKYSLEYEYFMIEFHHWSTTAASLVVYAFMHQHQLINEKIYFENKLVIGARDVTCDLVIIQ